MKIWVTENPGGEQLLWEDGKHQLPEDMIPFADAIVELGVEIDVTFEGPTVEAGWETPMQAVATLQEIYDMTMASMRWDDEVAEALVTLWVRDGR
jgi:hypothetical protein